MKKLSIILGSALVMLTAGCSKDATEDVITNDKTTTLGMNIEGSEDARTSLGEDGYAVLWSKGDCVAVNGVHTTIAEEFVGQSVADFTVSGVVPPYKAIYPADVLNEGGTITVSEIQEYAPASFAQGAAVMVGYSDNTSIKVKNLYGLVKLTVAKSADELIESVTLHSNNLEAMTGTFAVDYENAAITPLAGMDFVKVVATDGIAYGADGKAVIYIALPAGKYAKGFTIKVATDKGTMSRSVGKTTGVTIERSKIYTLPELTFKKNSNEADEITNATQLQAFLDAVNAGDYSTWENAYGEVVLGADIDLTGVTIKPCGKVTVTKDANNKDVYTYEGFDGIFNGRGYKLKNWKSDGTALFTTIMPTATVKNITIDESCSMDVSNAAAGNKAFIAANNLGIVSGCQNYADMVFAPSEDLTAQYIIGAIAGVSTSATAAVTNCYNGGNLTITIPSMTGGSYYFGGVAGNTKSGVKGHEGLSNSINAGDITVTIDGANGWKNVYLGGLSGASNNAGVVANCINKGKVDFYIDKAATGAYPNIGGITGYTACNITGCKNYGDVSIKVNAKGKSNSITRPAIGGIAGYANGNVTSCENYGYILLKGSESVKFGATGSYTTGGVGNMGHPVIGGICGCVGYPEETYTSNGKTTKTEASKKNITDCHNFGTVEVSSPTNATWIPIGGVVGMPTGTISGCVNEKSGVVKVTMGGAQTYLGGVYGCTVQPKTTIDGCVNYGKVWFVDSNAVALGKATTRSYTGGISGAYNDGSGNIATNCINEGEVIAEAKITMIAAGLFGAHNGTITGCVNRGTVTMKNATALEGSASELGGIVGYTNCPTASTVLMSGCANYGTITNVSDAGTDTGALIGALAGPKNIENCTVDCAIDAEGSNVGIVMGSTRDKNVGVTLGTGQKPIIVKKTTTINGVAVTDADILQDGGKLVGIFRAGSINLSNVVLE